MPNINTGDIAWILICSALALLMTPGLALFYGGLARSKNAASTIMHSLMSMGIVGVVWTLWGYTIAFGPDIGGLGLLGDLSYLGLSGVSATEPGPYADNMPHQAFMIFQGMFAIITPALVTGAFAERMKFGSYVLFTLLWVTIVYAPVARWVWGGGWIGELGALDFAGATRRTSTPASPRWPPRSSSANGWASARSRWSRTTCRWSRSAPDCSGRRRRLLLRRRAAGQARSRRRAVRMGRVRHRRNVGRAGHQHIRGRRLWTRVELGVDVR